MPGKMTSSYAEDRKCRNSKQDCGIFLDKVQNIILTKKVASVILSIS